MLVVFTVENFRSIDDEQSLSMVASKKLGKNHKWHLSKIPGSRAAVLKAAVIYGANGAGKSNLFRAIKFVRDSVMKQRDKEHGSGYQGFFLRKESNKSSCFDLQFVSGESLYRYGFIIDEKVVLEEWLYSINGGKQKLIFSRKTNQNDRVFVKASNTVGEGVAALAQIGGGANQTFLSTVINVLNKEQYGAEIEPVIEWFKKLVLISPGAQYGNLVGRLASDPELAKFAGSILKEFSTGVNEVLIRKEKITREAFPENFPKDMPGEVVSEIYERLQEVGVEKAQIDIDSGRAGRISLEKQNDFEMYRLFLDASHVSNAGEQARLSFDHESDGTKRLLNLIPALYNLKRAPYTYVIDEIDRSMHPILIRNFMKGFLNACKEQKHQIIVTTHESNLLDLELFRRDEIYFIEKDINLSTKIYSLSDYVVRNDLDVQKHYLQGRFGAIPFLGDVSKLIASDCAEIG